MQYSKYQTAIFDFGNSGKGNGRIEAVAGAGKTTTAMKLMEGLQGNGLFSTFTRVIIDEALRRIADLGLRNVVAKNYNSFGAGLIYKYMPRKPRLETANGKKTENILQYRVLKGEDYKVYNRNRAAIVRLVSLFKALSLKSVDEAYNQIEAIVDHYDVDLPKDNNGGSNFNHYLMDTWAVCLTEFDVIDFQDQVFVPVLLGFEPKQVDFLIIDEYQDTCPVESQLMQQACRNGRTIVFGDSYQAIYGFKGTKPGSMEEFGKTGLCTRLPLSICYRCSKAVVAEAKAIVNHIEPSDTAPEGSVNTITKDIFRKTVTPDDMVLCRVTEHLVESVLSFLKEGRAAYVVGREYGMQLSYFITKVCDSPSGFHNSGNLDYMSSSDFVDRMEAHYNENYGLLIKTGKDQAAMQLESKVESLRVLIIGCANVSELWRRINNVFTEKGSGIKHMTIHKAKGLECNNVFVLRPDKMPHPRARKTHMIEEENRLRYVAITRARVNLYYVLKDKDDK